MPDDNTFHWRWGIATREEAADALLKERIQEELLA